MDVERSREDKEDELEDANRRVLTEPSTRVGNGGFDNENSNLILCVNDVLRAEPANGKSFKVLAMLGEGTFGQVVKCEDCITKRQVAVKVIKNKPAYHNQAMMELSLLQMLNEQHDRENTAHIVRLLDNFSYKNHLCLVFEMLGTNLYEYIKGNGFRGLPCSLVRAITKQLLEALTILREARILHCDLKPENVLFVRKGSADIKLIDFGSACLDYQTVYTYVQSRFYRSPEVLFGLPYDSSMDMWSLGCIVAELFLGLPMFPGQSQHNQVSRIVKLLGLPEAYVLEKKTPAIRKFFNAPGDPLPPEEGGAETPERKCHEFSLKSAKQFARETESDEVQTKKYFNGDKLDEVVLDYPFKRGLDADGKALELETRRSLLHFIRGVLRWDPTTRWTPIQALLHPFITGRPLSTYTEPEPEAEDASEPTRGDTSVDEESGYAPWEHADQRRPRVSEAHVQYNAQYQDGVFIGSPPSRLSLCSNHSQSTSRGSMHLGDAGTDLGRSSDISGVGRRGSYNNPTSPGCHHSEDGRLSHGSMDGIDSRCSETRNSGTARQSVEFLQVPGNGNGQPVDVSSPERATRSISDGGPIDANSHQSPPTKRELFRTGGKSSSLILPEKGTLSPLNENFRELRIAPQLQHHHLQNLHMIRQEETKSHSTWRPPTAFRILPQLHSSPSRQSLPDGQKPRAQSRSHSLNVQSTFPARPYSPLLPHHATSPPGSPPRFTGRSPSSSSPSNSPSRPAPTFQLSSAPPPPPPPPPPPLQTSSASQPAPVRRQKTSDDSSPSFPPPPPPPNT